MKRISGRLEEVAEGNLTTKVSVKGHDEFNNLAVVANHMINNNKSLSKGKRSNRYIRVIGTGSTSGIECYERLFREYHSGN